MKKYKLNLKENEELIVDVDDLMEKELVKFKEEIKGLKEKEIKLFDNWVKIYKLLNYDIIEGLQVEKVYKFNDYSAIIELTFRGNKEYDLLNLNPKTMTVACMNVKKNSVRPYVVRRLLIPNTVEEALSFAKSELPEEGIKSVSKTIKELENNGEKYNVTEQIKINEKGFNKLDENKEKESKVKPEENKEKESKVNIEEENNSNIKSYNNYSPYNCKNAVLSSISNDGRINVLSLIRELR